MYGIDLTSREIRRRVRKEFEKNRYVTDINIIDRLVFKGRTEFEETVNQWKQKTHIMRYFNEDEYAPRKPVTFLEKFYSGR